MASGSPVGRANSSGTKGGFDFASDDILCSYEDFANQEASNGSHSDLVIGSSSSKDESGFGNSDDSVGSMTNHRCNFPRYDEMMILINPGSPHWKCPDKRSPNVVERSYTVDDDYVEEKNGQSEHGTNAEDPSLDVVFVHGLRGGPFKSWRDTFLASCRTNFLI